MSKFFPVEVTIVCQAEKTATSQNSKEDPLFYVLWNT